MTSSVEELQRIKGVRAAKEAGVAAGTEYAEQVYSEDEDELTGPEVLRERSLEPDDEVICVLVPTVTNGFEDELDFLFGDRRPRDRKAPPT